MRNKVISAICAAVIASVTANAGINVQWFVAYGVYPFGAGDTTDVTPGSGLLVNNGSGNTILQLIYAGADNQVDIVDPGNAGSGYVDDDDVVWATINVSNGVAGYDEWVYNTALPQYVDNAFTAGFVYARVFQDATPSGGEYYYSTGLLALSDVGADVTQSQVLRIGTPENGVSLNTEIVPEPSAMMLAGLGVLVVAMRRRRQA